MTRFDDLTIALARGCTRREALRLLGGTAAAAVLSLVGGGVATEAAGLETQKVCTKAFEATVTRGPNGGLKLVGMLTLYLGPGGDMTGQLVQMEDGSMVPVTGHTVGHQVELRFSLPQGTVVGTGALSTNLHACKAELFGGTLSGPTRYDTGNWLIGCSIVCRTSTECYDVCDSTGNNCVTKCYTKKFCLPTC
ncbi:MAG: hypothetical protein KIT87_19795 [Anaerolineae bacterium]|nr:hypothetical protein [Anaerolineae bacterium]